jgi:hypothetical protein
MSSAPQWLKDRMEALRNQPPVPLEVALRQWKALGDARRNASEKHFREMMVTEAKINPKFLEEN